MTRFFSSRLSEVEPYVPGEQPQDKSYVKLNTNESPFPPTPQIVKLAAEAAESMNLYSDPQCRALTAEAARFFGIGRDEILFSDGSDTLLNFAMVAFCDETRPAIYPDITYGFYPVIAGLNRIPVKLIPLKEDFTIDPADYRGLRGTIFLANPNAPTGIALSRDTIEGMLRANPDAVVVVDEAYVDFGAESCLPLIHSYDNLLVVQTFSKSRSLAGGRLGMCMGCADIIRDVATVKNSCDPYSVTRMTLQAGIGAFRDNDLVQEHIREIMRIRAVSAERLRALGFEMTDSLANFLFVRNDRIPGGLLYEKLKERGVLVRHFNKPGLTDYNRITVGSEAEMDILIERITEILEEMK